MLKFGGVGRAFFFGLGKGIEDVQLAGGLEKGLVIVRAVQVYQSRPQPFQKRQSDRRVVNKCLATASGLDDPPQNQQSVFAGVEAGFGECGINSAGVF